MELDFDYRTMLACLLSHEVDFLLVGGLNFFLAHQPVATADVDILIDDSESNRMRCEAAIASMDGQWGKLDADWGPVRDRLSGWLSTQGVYCLITKFGPLDVFRSLSGIDSFTLAATRSIQYPLFPNQYVRLISASDLLACQLALDESIRKRDRVHYLQRIVK
jgi:hypothetical protein